MNSISIDEIENKPLEQQQQENKNKKPIIILILIIIIQIIIIIFLYINENNIIIKKDENGNYILSNKTWKIIKTNNYKQYAKYSQNETILKIALLSDSHLDPSNPLKHPFSKTLKKSLETIKKQNVDIILFAGDLADIASKEAFNLFIEIYNEIFPSNSPSPILLVTMGNHDYFPNKNIYVSVNQAREMFEETFNQKYQDHFLINDFHFILWGNIDGEYYEPRCNYKWVINEINNALNDENFINKDFPIFVITHFPPINTTHHSTFWGNKDINLGLNNYYNVINLCAHSHTSLIDERAIDQKNFTVINAQPTSRVCTESCENGYISIDEFGSDEISYKNYMGVIMFLRKGSIEVKRIFLDDNSFYDKNWYIPFPIKKENFNYTDNRVKNNKKPFFEGDYNISINKVNNRYFINFKQAKHEYFVYAYNISFSNSSFYNIYRYISDFFLKEKDRREYITFALNNRLTKGKYNITIIAFDSFELESINNLTQLIELN